MKKTIRTLICFFVIAIFAFSFTACFDETDKSANKITELTIDNWTYGETAKTPVAKALFGTPAFTYSSEEAGVYEATVPTDAGTYYVKARVEETSEYTAAEKVVSFEIAKADDEVSKPATVAETLYCGKSLPTEFGSVTATSGSAITFKYSRDGVTYVESIAAENVKQGTYYVKAYSAGNKNYNAGESESTAITVEHKHEVKEVDGVWKNICVCGDEIELNQEDNEITELTIDNWTYGETAKTPVATALYGTPEFTYSSEEFGTYNVAIPTDAGTYYVKATINPTADYKGAVKVVSFTIGQASDVVSKPVAPEGPLHCGNSLPTEFGTVTATSGSAITFKYSGDGITYVESIAAENVKKGKYYVKAYSAGNNNYIAGESEAIEITVEHNFELKEIAEKWKNICACGEEQPLPKVSLSFTVDGEEKYSTEVDYGSKVTDEIIEAAKTAIVKSTDRKILSINCDKEISLTENAKFEIVMDYGVMVDASALQISSLSNGNNPYAVPTTEVTAPVGFTKVHKSTTKITGSNMLYSVLNLTNYKSVYFALKTDGTFLLGKTSTEKVEYNGKKWMIFRITHNADGATWDISVNDEDGNLLVEAKGFKADRNDGMYVANALSTILYGNRNGNEGYICSSDATVLYATEIRADRTDERRKIAPIGEIIKADSADLMLFDEDKIKLGELPSDNADGALYATGFEKIYKSTWHSDNSGYIDRALSDKNVTGDYSEIRFAIMTDRCICYYNTMNPSKTGCLTWWYFTLVRDETTDKWTVTVTDEGGRVIATKDNLNETYYGSNSLDSILWGSWGGFRLTNDHTNETEWVVYCTEIRGVKKSN